MNTITTISNPQSLGPSTIHLSSDTFSNPLTKTAITIIAPTTSCPICLEDIPSSKILSPLKCNHSFCHECLTEYLKSSIRNLKVLNIPCPYSGCSITFTERSLQKILDKITFKAYQSAMLKKIMSRNPDAKFCPTPGCSRQIKISTHLPYTECRCTTKICNICCNPWHEGKTCLESIDPEFETYAKEQNIKFCMMCKSHIQKTEGCKHITCPVCDYEWCWDCGEKYTDNHQLKCAKTWAPTPPNLSLVARIKETWKTSSVLRKGIFVLASLVFLPIILIGAYLLWPLWTYYDPQTDLSKKKPFKTAYIIIECMVVGFLISPILIALGSLGLVSYIILLPCTLISSKKRTDQVYESAGKAKQEEKRWESRNPKDFKFVVKVISEENNQDGIGLPTSSYNAEAEIITFEDVENRRAWLTPEF